MYLKLTLVACAMSLSCASLRAQSHEDRTFVEDETGLSKRYRIFSPEDDGSKPLPLIMYLVGGGFDLGQNELTPMLEKIRSGQYAAYFVEVANTDNFFTRCDGPLDGSGHIYCPPGISDGMRLALGIYDHLEQEFNTDTSRRLIMGFSSGATGTYDLLDLRPGFFEAAVLFGTGHDFRRFRQPVDTRVWAVQGHNDPFAVFLTEQLTEQMRNLDDSVIFLEPPGVHHPNIVFPYLEDPDDEFFPWFYEGIDPPIANLIYDPITGNVKIDATSAPGGTISGFRLSGSGFIASPAPDQLDGGHINVLERGARKTITYMGDSDGFGGVVDLGNILEPNLGINDLHLAINTSNYNSSSSTVPNRTFQFLRVPSEEISEPRQLIEEPWYIYSVNERRGITVSDLGLATTADVGRFVRSVISKFELPLRENGAQQLESAVLRVYVTQVDMNQPDASLALRHSASANGYENPELDNSDPSYNETGLMLIPMDATAGSYYEVDVTEFVRQDYAVDGDAPVSSFRWEVLNGSESAAPFTVEMPHQREHPIQLELSFAVDSGIDCRTDEMIGLTALDCASEKRDADLGAVLLAEIGIVAGDLDGNGAVEFQDFLILSANFGGAGGYSSGDVDFNGSLGFSDFVILGANFGFRSFPSTDGMLVLDRIDEIRPQILNGNSLFDAREAFVPEPSSFVLTTLSFLGLLVQRRRQPIRSLTEMIAADPDCDNDRLRCSSEVTAGWTNRCDYGLAGYLQRCPHRTHELNRYFDPRTGRDGLDWCPETTALSRSADVFVFAPCSRLCNPSRLGGLAAIPSIIRGVDSDLAQLSDQRI